MIWGKIIPNQSPTYFNIIYLPIQLKSFNLFQLVGHHLQHTMTLKTDSYMSLVVVITPTRWLTTVRNSTYWTTNGAQCLAWTMLEEIQAPSFLMTNATFTHFKDLLIPLSQITHFVNANLKPYKPSRGLTFGTSTLDGKI